MFSDVDKIIKLGNYQEAKEKLSQLNIEEKDRLWYRYYTALILEKEGNLSLAETNYRAIIKDTIYPDSTLIKLIRDGIERIVKIYKAKKEEKKQEFQNIENSQDLAVLILEPVKPEEKKNLAPLFAKLMAIDNYTAILQIPTRSLRLYKTGSLGELKYYESELCLIGIPCFCYRIKSVNEMQVYQVKYLENQNNIIELMIENDLEEEKKLTLNWENVSNKVQGLIPIFEMITHLDARNKIQKKQATLDYANFFDLHLVKDNLIVRFSDHFYQFDSGLTMGLNSKTTQEKWKYLLNYLQEKTPNIGVNSNFNLFAEGAIQFPEMLKQITAHVNLFRREESVWDQAFHLYSGLIFLQTLSQQKRENIESFLPKNR